MKRKTKTLAAALILTSTAAVVAWTLRSGPPPTTQAAPSSKYGDTVRFDTKRDCVGHFSSGSIPDYADTSGAPTPLEAIRGEVGVIRQQHGELTTHVVSGAVVAQARDQGRASVVYRLDNAQGLPVAEIDVHETAPGAWQVFGTGSCSPVPAPE